VEVAITETAEAVAVGDVDGVGPITPAAESATMRPPIAVIIVAISARIAGVERKMDRDSCSSVSSLSWSDLLSNLLGD
jgi:hypothetical protein